jgi:hypothetical protein
MVQNYLWSSNAHQWEQSLQPGTWEIFQFDGERMLNVQIGQTLTGISLIVDSVGTLRWIGGAWLSFHNSRQCCSVHGSTVQVGRVRTVKKLLQQIIIFQNGLVNRTYLEKSGFAISFIGLT